MKNWIYSFFLAGKSQADVDEPTHLCQFSMKWRENVNEFSFLVSNASLPILAFFISTWPTKHKVKVTTISRARTTWPYLDDPFRCLLCEHNASLCYTNGKFWHFRNGKVHLFEPILLQVWIHHSLSNHQYFWHIERSLWRLKACNNQMKIWLIGSCQIDSSGPWAQAC